MSVFVGQAIKGEPLSVDGDGQQTRCSCHVGDVVDAMLRIADHPEASGRAYDLDGIIRMVVQDQRGR